MMAFFAYFAHRQTQPSIERPVRLPGFMRWVALAVGIVCAVLLIFGGWNSASVVLGTTDHALFFVGVLVLATYVPLHLWRRFSDKRRPEVPAEPSLPVAAEAEPELSV
jgi:amino acid transporter